MLRTIGRYLTRSGRVLSSVVWGGGTKTAAGVTVSEESALQLALFFRCLEVKSETLGSLPVGLYRASPDTEQEGRPVVYTEASRNPIHKVLRHRPNPLEDPMEFIMRISLDLDLFGNWYGLPEYGMNGKLQALWRIPPDCVRPYWVEFPREIAYEYVPPGTEGRADCAMQTLLPGQIVHIKTMPVTTAGSNYSLKGVGLLELQKETLGLSVAARNFAADMFRNKAVPAGILSYRGMLSEDKRKQLSEDWDRRHSEENRYRTAVITGDIDFKPIANRGVEMQVFEQKQAANVDITVITGVPPAALGLNTGVTYSNTREQMRAFHAVTISQRAKLIAKGLEKGLIPDRQRDKLEIRFDLAEMMRGDDLVRARYLETMVRIGAYSPNDVLAVEGRNPRPGGNVYTLLPGAGQQQPDNSDDSGGAGGGDGAGESEPADGVDSAA